MSPYTQYKPEQETQPLSSQPLYEYPPQPQWGAPPPDYSVPPLQWQQPPYPQQAPPYLQPQPPMHQPKTCKPMSRGILIACGAVAALVVLVAIIAIAIGAGNKGSTSNTANTQATQPVQQQLTPAPTATPSPTVLPPGKQLVVGGTDTAFIARYGNPIKTTTSSGGKLLYFNTSDSNIGTFAVAVPVNTHVVFAILIAPFPSETWDTTTAKLISSKYMPDDAKFDSPKKMLGAFHFFAHASPGTAGVDGGRLRKGLRQE